MKVALTLKTGDDRRVYLILDAPDSGLDNIRRRWTFEAPYWRCIDSGEVAEQSGPAVAAAS